MTLTALFDRCLHIPYTHVENDGDYAVKRIGNTLFLYFEASNGLRDWKHNLDFPTKPYKRMGRTLWFAHRGFLKVWKSVEGYIAHAIRDPTVQNIVITGYSHGAAIAVLCHEYVWYHRPDLRDSLRGYGFGCPRVIGCFRASETEKRFENFTVIRNIDDIVTHMPPACFGFSHVGKLLTVGERGKYSRIDAHRPENIRTELQIYEATQRRPSASSCAASVGLYKKRFCQSDSRTVLRCNIFYS